MMKWECQCIVVGLSLTTIGAIKSTTTPSGFVGDEGALEDRGEAVYSRGGYRIDSCSGLWCKKYDVCITLMCSIRGMSIGHVRVHFYGLSGDSKPFVG